MSWLLLASALVFAGCILTILGRHMKGKPFTIGTLLDDSGGVESREPLDGTEKILALVSVIAFLAMLWLGKKT